ncbi:hypothetical protein [Mangrovicoccus algicola]|uniref:Uncharacterized protein n=1 Tax=Mangrovicoccus algicola TaxID=2771008 RepID=A0A8J6Z4E0_9RHOB|nr:hypothetical protein [Mangrovicoccus algicola]MBE3637374.1 hypothetical protein [Mangrovicoccus algicola]
MTSHPGPIVPGGSTETPTAISSQTSRGSLSVARPAELRLQIEDAEINRVRSALSSLGAWPSDEEPTWANIKDIERNSDGMYLCRLHRRSWFVPKAVTKDQVAAAAAALIDQPADTAALRVALYQLWLSTKHEKMAEEDRNAMLTIYARNLAIYPAEQVRLVLAEYAEKEKFWPSWAELHTRLSGLSIARAALTAGLRVLCTKIENANA